MEIAELTTLSGLITDEIDLSKENQLLLAESLTEDILANYNPLDSYIKLKAYNEVLNLVEKGIKEDAIDEASKYGKNDNFINEAKFEVVNAASRYDYSADQEWKELKAKLKEREEFLKGLQKPMADPDTGEIINPAIKKLGVETIRITYPKS